MTDALMYTDTNGDAHVVGVMSDNAKDIHFDNTGTSFTSDDVDGVLREVDNKIDSMGEVVTHQNQDQTITIYTQGKHADLYLDANTTTGVPLAGLQLPDNIKPKKTIYFVGKAGDYWNQAYRITSGSGLLTARDGADREDIAVQWARGHVSFIMQ